MQFWQYVVLFLSVILGGGLAFFVQQNYRRYLQLVLAFSGAYILAISVLHLLPTIFYDGNERIGLWILMGFFVQLFLEMLSRGVEHGHIHAPHEAHTGFALQLMLGLCIHAFVEGMPLGYYTDIHEATMGHSHGTDHLLFGIITHKAPAAFALVLLMLVARYSRPVILLCLFTFALMSPMGAALATLLEQNELLNPLHLRNITAFVVGSFLHIATTILFEQDSSGHHRISLPKLLAIGLGFGLSILTMH
ncbi:MAG: ZIP family metal transporter [Bacteroidota bacterium]